MMTHESTSKQHFFSYFPESVNVVIGLLNKDSWFFMIYGHNSYNLRDFLTRSFKKHMSITTFLHEVIGDIFFVFYLLAGFEVNDTPDPIPFGNTV